MNLKDDLVAVKALIDTPEKWRDIGAVGAFEQVGGRNTVATRLMVLAVMADIPNTSLITHTSLMASFDRAIEAAE